MSTHKLKIVKICIFFFRKPKKKKYSRIFFFPEKVYLHSLNFFGGGHIKNKLKKQDFSKSGSFNPKYVVFFYTMYCIFFLMYFFFLKKFKSHSITHFKPCIFFSGHRKKKYIVFTHSHNFAENVPKMIFFKKKKKYGTFALITVFFIEWRKIQNKTSYVISKSI